MGVASAIFKLGIGALGMVVTGYVVHEVQKEYDSTVEENNKLRDFINNHDFYERLPEDNKPMAELEKEAEYTDNEGRAVNVYEDKVSGFKLFVPERARKRA